MLGIDATEITVIEFIDYVEETGIHIEPSLQERQQHQNIIFLNTRILDSIRASRPCGNALSIFECAVEAQLSQASFVYEPRLLKHPDKSYLISETLFLTARRIEAELIVIQKLLAHQETQSYAFFGWLFLNESHPPCKESHPGIKYLSRTYDNHYRIYGSCFSETNIDTLYIAYNHCNRLIDEWKEKHSDKVEELQFEWILEYNYY